MSTRLGRMLEDWRAWRACRKANLHTQIPTPEPRLNTFETFLHLRPWQRVACVVCCFVAYVLCIQPTFTANVAPHFIAIVGPDGRFNVHELIQTLTLSSFVIILTASPLLMLRAPWFGKVGIVVMSLFIAYTTLDNACNVQEEGRATKNDAPRQKADRIARLDAEIRNGEKAYNQVPSHEHVLATTVQSAEAQLETLKTSANDECHRGFIDQIKGNGRGPKCGELEKKRDAKAEEVEKLQRNAGLTQRATDIEVALGQLKSERAKLGAAPEITGSELERFPALLADFGVPMWFAKALSDHHPEIIATTQELIAWFGSPAAVAFVFWLFGLLVCEKSEADKRVLDMTKAVMEERAKVVLSVVPHVGRADISAEQMEPDHSPESVLEIEGEAPPAFARNPETIAEAMAAAVLKADPKKPRVKRARTKQPPHRDSVLAFHKERLLEREGRSETSDKVIQAYVDFCWARNQTPVSPQTFGNVMKKEFGIEKKKVGGTIRYFDIGLRPALRVVSG